MKQRRRPLAGDEDEGDEHQDHRGAQPRDRDDVQALPTTPELDDFVARPRSDFAEKLVDRGHDLGFGGVILRTMHEAARALDIRLSLHCVASSRITESDPAPTASSPP